MDNLLLTVFNKLQVVPNEFWAVLCQMAPYLLFGFLVAGVLSVLISQKTVEQHLGGRGIWPTVKAAVFGVPLPLCSCGVIPVAATLRRHGASRGATAAFLLSTPQTGVDSILVTWSLLGPIFAFFRPIAALLSGILGGVAVNFFEANGNIAPPSLEKCTDPCCMTGKRRKILRAFEYGFVFLPRDIGRHLLIGLIVAGLITALVPRDFFGSIFGTGVGVMFIMMLVGIPVYVCATASVPIAAALIHQGISPGAALVFLITGPATNAATVAVVWRIMGYKIALVYLATVAITAVGSGLALDYLFNVAGNVTLPMHVHQQASPLGIASAIILLILLFLAILRRSHEHEERMLPTPTVGAESKTIVLRVTGMKCVHCVQSVTSALLETPGVQSVDVDLANSRATISGPAPDVEALLHAARNLGYNATRED